MAQNPNSNLALPDSGSYMPEKVCSGCKISRPISEFHNVPAKFNRPYNKQSYCKFCASVRSKEYRNKRTGEKVLSDNKKAKFNKYRWKGIRITDVEYEKMYSENKGICNICGITDLEFGKILDLDHCHATGEIRGFLCGNCNRGLGVYKDSEDLLNNAISYLENHGSKTS